MSNKTAPKKKYFYDMAPKKIEDKSLSKDFLSIAKNEQFTAYEILSGIDFILVCDSGDLTIHADKNVKDVVELFNAIMVKPISRLIQHIGENIDFSVYGVYVSHDESRVNYVGPSKMFFYDMYLNSNWLRNDDFIELFNRFEIPIAPVIKSGVMNSNFIQEVNSSLNSHSNLQGMNEVFGVYFKSLNGIGEHRNIEKGAYTYYNEKYRKNEKSYSKQQEKEYQTKIEEVGYLTVTEDIMDSWDVILKARNIKKSKDNIDKIMPIVMADYINKHTEERELLALEIEVSESEAEKLMKKYISKIIVSKFFKG